ncbi:alpha-1,3-mannosyl-glycoprotein 4-beta-N-acetylglucosaminyltransferase C isoform X1 [Electrophorus electricus]|nr:alpha-1,3-mannosyl-glycoprotein 4-beta-N-acetylglucosaminyltransferase C isoform X1 [Electrophorus electricus]XP_035378291.1 alpha-1,3-mannosyl-glycoprotein 4-beta-N-acetylglucosaminyltransferase C isoform X1 [Electrophorus electricus]XP_035378292.1 alpha-1,3-mannosyl-glycoprotein 4-beta-N-acetylglucosaminyltransferase C isoform X1 [Electrophorus electricus]
MGKQHKMFHFCICGHTVSLCSLKAPEASEMRVRLKVHLQAIVGLLILACLYLSFRREQWTEQTEMRRWSWNFNAGRLSSGSLSMASARLLAGVPQQDKKYLTVGLSSVRRKKENYLLSTLYSIFSQSSEKELADMVVVVLLADFDLQFVQETLRSIMEKFSSRLSQGQLLVIHVDEEHYPPLTGLKRNFNDAPDRVTFRSKQNMDYAHLVHFCANLSRYYLMLEDDVSCSKGFLSAIRGHIHSLGSSPWTSLEFSKLGYIGKLYHSSDLLQLGHFLYIFYQELPCDFLMSHFRTLLMQDKPIRFRPSLFQHMGTYSSFQSIYNKLKDEDFDVDPGHNPAADVYTDIGVYNHHLPQQAYENGPENQFFWGKSPIKEGNFFLVAFHEPVVVSRILIQTGKDGNDMLVSADVELGETVTKGATGMKCTGSHTVGSLREGQFEQQDMQRTLKSPVLCLNIRVTAPQTNWVIIKGIQVWTVKENKNEQVVVAFHR